MLCSCLDSISEPLNARIEQEYINYLAPDNQSYESNSLDGQRAGFFDVLDDWLMNAAKQMGGNLDKYKNKDFTREANIGLKLSRYDDLDD